jgi:hypothetical protein
MKMKMRKAPLVLIACLASASPAGYADTAVSQTNVQVQASYGVTDYDTYSYNLDYMAGHVALQIPIGGALGVSVEGVIGRAEFGSSYEYDYYLYMASLFARSPDLGLLGVGIGGSEIKIDPPYRDTSSTDYQAIAAAYLGPVTLAMTRSYSDDKDTADTENHAWTDLTWYVMPNLLLDVTAGFMDSEHDYTLALEHQIGNAGFSYGLSYSWNNDIDAKSYYLSLSYRFGAGKPLQERYRRDLYSAR